MYLVWQKVNEISSDRIFEIGWVENGERNNGKFLH